MQIRMDGLSDCHDTAACPGYRTVTAELADLSAWAEFVQTRAQSATVTLDAIIVLSHSATRPQSILCGIVLARMSSLVVFRVSDSGSGAC